MSTFAIGDRVCVISDTQALRWRGVVIEVGQAEDIDSAEWIDLCQCGIDRA